MENNNPVSDTQAAIEAGKQLGAAKVQEVNGVPVVLATESVEVVPLREFMDRPQRIEQRVEVKDADSFIDYYNVFCPQDGGGVVFCDTENAEFVGVLDYHNPGTPDWCEHVVRFECTKTREWIDWTENDGQAMDQIRFAYFIEQHMDEIVEPKAAEMLEIVTSLKANNKVTFESGVRLADGQVQLQYREELDGQAGIKGELKIPEEFTLGIRVFEGEAAYKVVARFRHRIREGKVMMWYDLVRPHNIVRDAVDSIAERIREKVTADLFLNGRI